MGHERVLMLFDPLMRPPQFLLLDILIGMAASHGEQGLGLLAALVLHQGMLMSRKVLLVNTDRCRMA